jgi:hypothetical protein
MRRLVKHFPLKWTPSDLTIEIELCDASVDSTCEPSHKPGCGSVVSAHVAPACHVVRSACHGALRGLGVVDKGLKAPPWKLSIVGAETVHRQLATRNTAQPDGLGDPEQFTDLRDDVDESFVRVRCHGLCVWSWMQP